MILNNISDKNLCQNLIWDNQTIDILKLENNDCSLKDIKTYLQKNNLLKGNSVKINEDISKLYKTKYNKKSIRLNIFLAYMLSHHSLKNEEPSYYHCNFKKKFKEIPSNDLDNILNTFNI